jgi:hypothetical protein
LCSGGACQGPLTRSCSYHGLHGTWTSCWAHSMWEATCPSPCLLLSKDSHAHPGMHQQLTEGHKALASGGRWSARGAGVGGHIQRQLLVDCPIKHVVAGEGPLDNSTQHAAVQHISE